ncbi:MAG: hypothetical protein M3Z33_03160 [Actinomycetota bacterium]|nr:hypothetical protein [Actinomycetota bacterium]
MRTAAILALGFLAVFLVSLIAAPGSESPPRSTTRSCGPYVASGRRRGRYVAYATRLDCSRARRVALAYTAGHVCRRTSMCRGVVEGLDCMSAGSAGPRLVWVGCGHGKRIHKPRVFFSVNHAGPAAAEGPDAPALPS